MILRRLENKSSEGSVSEEDGNEPLSQDERQLVVEYKSRHGQHEKTQDIKVNLGLFLFFEARLSTRVYPYFIFQS